MVGFTPTCDDCKPGKKAARDDVASSITSGDHVGVIAGVSGAGQNDDDEDEDEDEDEELDDGLKYWLN